MSTPMNEGDIEAQLQQRIKEQAAQIAVALGYLHAGKPELASEVLEAALPNFRKPSFNQGKVLQA